MKTIGKLYTLPPALRGQAASWVKNKNMPGTQAERLAAMKAFPIAERGGLALPQAAEVVRKAVEDSGRAAQTRHPMARRRHDCRSMFPNARRKAEKVFDAPLAERLDFWRKSALSVCFYGAYRTAAHGRTGVVLTGNPAEVGVYQDTYQEGNYGGKFKSYRITRIDTTITAPTHWRTRVYKRGLALCGGLFTLDASPLDNAPEGTGLYAAKWVAQGRGNQLHMVEGVIATDGAAESYHADTAEKALAGLAKKLKAKALQIEAPKIIEALQSVPADRLAKIHVAYSDARRVGACDYGIRSWCNASAIDPDQGCNLVEMLAAYAARPQPEARAVIVAMVRKHRLLQVAA